jgi:hypothetical protein
LLRERASLRSQVFNFLAAFIIDICLLILIIFWMNITHMSLHIRNFLTQIIKLHNT